MPPTSNKAFSQETQPIANELVSDGIFWAGKYEINAQDCYFVAKLRPEIPIDKVDLNPGRLPFESVKDLKKLDTITTFGQIITGFGDRHYSSDAFKSGKLRSEVLVADLRTNKVYSLTKLEDSDLPEENRKQIEGKVKKFVDESRAN